MTWTLPADWHDTEAAAAAWRAAEPFPHLVADAVADADAILAILDDEHVDPYADDIFMFEATAPEPQTAAFRALRDAFAGTFAPALAQITGAPVTRVDMRAYAYRPGHYLLPHTDHRDGLDRRLAYAYYLPSPEPPVGGELELYRGMVSARLIEPRGNRLVVFAVGDASLHQVREVLAGLRLSLAGWFYP